jgi:hypothetical protein
MIEKILPALITVIGNIIFYLWIKGRIEKSIEKNKIAYSGIFKEKIDIYRMLLEKTFVIKKELNQFQYVGTKEVGIEIMQKINDYIQFYSINQPFLSDEMLSNLEKIRAEYQEVFEKLYKHISSEKGDFLDDFFEAGNKLKENNTFKKIENEIIKEMRKDLKIVAFKK